jgi:hypothetical protein
MNYVNAGHIVSGIALSLFLTNRAKIQIALAASYIMTVICDAVNPTILFSF